MKEYRKHIKLLKEIRHLSWKIKGTRQLTTHQRWQAQNDTLIKLLELEDNGKVILDGNYNTYKNLMFIILRNFIYRVHEKKKTGLYQHHHFYLEETYDNITYTLDDVYGTPGTQEMLFEADILRTIINNLPPYKRALLRWNMRGWSVEYIGKAIGKSRTATQAKINNIKKALK